MSCYLYPFLVYILPNVPFSLLIDPIFFLPSIPPPVLVVSILCIGGSCKNDLYRQYDMLIVSKVTQ